MALIVTMQRILVQQHQVPQLRRTRPLPPHPLALALALPAIRPQTLLRLQNMLQNQSQNQNQRLSKVQKNLGIESEAAIYMNRLGHAFSHQDIKMAYFQACRCYALGQPTMLRENAQRNCPLEWLAVSRIVGECWKLGLFFVQVCPQGQSTWLILGNLSLLRKKMETSCQNIN